MKKNSELKPQLILEKINSLLLYQSVFENEIGITFKELLQTICLTKIKDKKEKNGFDFNCDRAYGKWFKIMAANRLSWQKFLIIQILQDDNPFSQQVQKQTPDKLNPSLVAAAKHDLKNLQIVYNCQAATIQNWLENILEKPKNIVTWDVENQSDRSFLEVTKNWENSLEELGNYYREKGTGIFAKYRAFAWQQGELQGIDRPDPIEIESLTGYETQKQAIIKNTEALLQGYRALNVLLYGSRGTGKSSLVKSLLTKYGDRGLRLIEVSKSELYNLPQIIEKLREVPQKFIIFVDDLSFEEDDDKFKALKVILEGSLIAKPKNMVIYATSNRRHLVREFFGDRPSPAQQEEIHALDTMQEKLSFSDRFGLSLTFSPPDLETYLNIVRHLAARAELKIEEEELIRGAKQWAMHHNGRSGRTAQQFIDYTIAQLT
ncbi:MAG: ATP-binding protein [Prochloraceae cyanobacterium]